jgi:hypothetical protein
MSTPEDRHHQGSLPAVSQSPASPNSENSKANPINSVKSACGIWEKICPVESRKIAKK